MSSKEEAGRSIYSRSFGERFTKAFRVTRKSPVIAAKPATGAMMLVMKAVVMMTFLWSNRGAMNPRVLKWHG